MMYYKMYQMHIKPSSVMQIYQEEQLSIHFMNVQTIYEYCMFRENLKIFYFPTENTSYNPTTLATCINIINVDFSLIWQLSSCANSTKFSKTISNILSKTVTRVFPKHNKYFANNSSKYFSLLHILLTSSKRQKLW